MRAARFIATGEPLRIDACPVPEPGDDDILVRVSACGICGTDLHAVDPGASQIRAGTILGHEFSGVVAASRSPLWTEGDRVIGFPVKTCDDCRATGECRRKLDFLCPDARVLGLSPEAPGAYAQYVVIDGRKALAAPPQIDDDAAALVEPMAVGAHAVRCAGQLAGSRVLVLGAGPIGLAVILFALHEGAAEVIVSEPDASRRERARAIGASQVCDPAMDDLAGCLPQPPDVIFECVGKAGLLQQCIDLVAVHGRILIVGVNRGEDVVLPRKALWKAATLRFVLGYTREDFVAAIDRLRSDPGLPGKLITRIIGLDELPALFEELRRPNGHNKVLIRPNA